ESCLAARADQHLAVSAYAPAPRALPAVRVYLPGSAPIAGHPVPICRAASQPAPLLERRKCLLVLGDVTCLWDRVHDLPADDAGLVDDESSPGGDPLVFIEDTVGLRDTPVWPEVAQHSEIEMIPLGPGAQRVARIDRYREQLDVVAVDLRKIIAQC